MDFKKTFPMTHADIISILQNLLEFNPYFRKKPEDLLKMGIFDKHRADHKEFLVPPTIQIKLEIDEKKAFNYEKSEFSKLTIQDLKNLLLNEVDIIRSMNLYNS